jgi:SAM-dependent methyltransferase
MVKREPLPPGPPEQEVARRWDENASAWAEQVRAGADAYRELYNNPAMLEFIGDVGGRDVLDAGCGEGYQTRILARRGARMIGVDLSARMIELARAEERREPLGIRYEEVSFSDLSIFADCSFDVCVSFMALMDGPDFPAAMRELRRVLRPGGRLVFSILHPCFATRGMQWIRDESGNETGLVVAEYFADDPWIERWKFTKAPDSGALGEFAVPRFDRILSDYLNAVVAAGFALTEIREPRPSADAAREHPWLRRWRIHAPLFLYVKALNPS